MNYNTAANDVEFAKPRLSMNLQLFAEGEEPTPGPEPTPEPTPEPEPSPEPSPEPTPEPTPEPDITKTQAFAHRLKEETARASQIARDAFISEQGYEWNGKPITTEREYREALREQEIRNTLSGQELPEEVVNELVESRKFREEAKAERQTKEQQEAQQKDYISFTEAYPDVKPEEIPVDVWESVNKGKSLVDAYQGHENKALKAKIAEFEAKLKAQETNTRNAESSPGSVTGNGNNVNQYFTADQVKAMTPAQVKHHYSSIEESMKKWNN